MPGKAIIYHKNPASAKTSFFRFEWESVLGLESLETPARLIEPTKKILRSSVQELVSSVEKYFALEAGKVLHEEEFIAEIENSEKSWPVLLLQIKTTDIPSQSDTTRGGRFIALTDARDLSAIDLELLQKAYRIIMEG